MDDVVRDLAKWYAMLGLPYGADEREVTKAFRAKALKVHPDKRGGDNPAFLALHDAYKKLVNWTRSGGVPAARAQVGGARAPAATTHFLDCECGDGLAGPGPGTS